MVTIFKWGTKGQLHVAMVSLSKWVTKVHGQNCLIN